jgi:putative addiction module component (TIGR02574 family)
MAAESLLDKALALPSRERLELVGRLWESLQMDPEAFPLTEEQRQTLDRREQEMEKDPQLGSSWQDVKARVWPKP